MISKLKTLAQALHSNERGDMAQIVLAVALIVIPLMLMLLAFGERIGNWFKDQNSELDSAHDKVPKEL